MLKQNRVVTLAARQSSLPICAILIMSAPVARLVLVINFVISFCFVKSYLQSTRLNVPASKLDMSSKFEGYRQTDTKTGAYQIAAANPIKMPCIILVNPFLDQNVGSVARAMVSIKL